jgi:hypothetical protein
MDTRQKCGILATAFSRMFGNNYAVTVQTKRQSVHLGSVWLAWSDDGGSPRAGATEAEAIANLAAYLRTRVREQHAKMTFHIAVREQELAAKRAILIDLTTALDATED